MSLVMPDPTPPSGKDKLDEILSKLWNDAMGKLGMYKFDGTGTDTFTKSQAKVAIQAYIAQQNQQAVQKAEASITKLQTDLGAAMGHMEGCGHPYKYLIEHYPDLAALAAAQPRKDGDASS